MRVSTSAWANFQSDQDWEIRLSMPRHLRLRTGTPTTALLCLSCLPRLHHLIDLSWEFRKKPCLWSQKRGYTVCCEQMWGWQGKVGSSTGFAAAHMYHQRMGTQTVRTRWLAKVWMACLCWVSEWRRVRRGSVNTVTFFAFRANTTNHSLSGLRLDRAACHGSFYPARHYPAAMLLSSAQGAADRASVGVWVAAVSVGVFSQSLHLIFVFSRHF